MKSPSARFLIGEDLTSDFFRRPPADCARDLLGCVFRWNGCEGRIVETESYEEFDDPACHTWNRPTAREFIASHDTGTSYVYLNYGIHWLFNVLTKSSDSNGFVLIRAIEPLSGLEEMKKRRGVSDLRSLCSGPGKLTKALGISGIHHGIDFLGGGETGIRWNEETEVQMGGRIGVSRATERPWRFGSANSAYLSRKF